MRYEEKTTRGEPEEGVGDSGAGGIEVNGGGASVWI